MPTDLSFSRSVGRFVSWSLAPLMAVASAGAIAADDATGTSVASGGLEEVIVTARKQNERLQDTPISITAFTEDSLRERNIERLSDLTRFTPNLVLESGTGGTGGSANAQIFVRGIGQADFLFTSDPGVGIYIDGVFFPRALGAILDVVDLERIEILRGPQGTLFGRNTIGGAISLTSARPADVYQAKGEVTIGNFDRLDFKGSVDIPLGERLATKVSFSSQNRDGYVTRLIDGEKLGDIDSDAVRGQLVWNASDSLEVHFSADYTRRREETIATSAVGFGDTGTLLNLWNAFAGRGTYGSAYATGDPFKTYATGPSYSDLDLWGVAATINYNPGAVGLKSITSYRSQKARFAGDDDNSPLQYLETNNNDRQRALSQEFQLSGTALASRLKWLVGAFYLHEGAANANHNWLYPGLYAGLEALPGPIDGSPLSAPTAPGGPGNPRNIALDGNQLRLISQDTDSYALYTHGIYAITPKLSFSGGIRYSYDRKEFAASVLRVDANVYILPPGTQAAESWSSVSPKVGFEYRWSEDVMGYASVARGFKSGGFNGRPRQATAALEPFDPEKALAYEIGIKSSWLDRRLLLNAAAFYTDYEDIQFLAVTTVNNDVVAIVDNAGEARVQGLEIELAARPAPGFDLSLGIGYTDAEYTKIAPGVTDVNLNSKFPKTPEWNGSLGLQYSVPVSTGVLSWRADYSYRTDVETVANNSPWLAQDAFGLLSARIALTSQDGRREFAVFGTNLTDEVYITNGLEAMALFGQAEANYGRPREWGASFLFRF